MFYTFDLLPFPGQPLFVLRVFVWFCRTKKDECRCGGSSTRDVRLNCINYGVWELVGSSSLAAVDWDLLHYLTTLKHELIFPYLHQISVHYFRSMDVTNVRCVLCSFDRCPSASMTTATCTRRTTPRWFSTVRFRSNEDFVTRSISSSSVPSPVRPSSIAENPTTTSVRVTSRKISCDRIGALWFVYLFF